jgi:RimJ/RimL family protein N-acetyltransferase
MIHLESFRRSDFDRLISWIDSAELLITIAGNEFTFPLTHDQLDRYLLVSHSHLFNVVDTADKKVVGHAQLIRSGDGMYKIDKLLIGDKTNRGKGRGQAVINALLTYAFENLNAEIVELNVFDWNIAGIKCYEKCGFKVNPGKKQVFKVGDESWDTINMVVKKKELL